MKRATSKQSYKQNDELRPEYDFSGAVRGKHYYPLEEGYTIKIYKADGTTEVQEMKFEAGTVRLEPDVREFFPDSQAVNQALRSLIALMAELPDMSKKKQTSRKKPKPAASSQKEIVKPG